MMDGMPAPGVFRERRMPCMRMASRAWDAQVVFRASGFHARAWRSRIFVPTVGQRGWVGYSMQTQGES